ncbi:MULTISPECIES: hypothetical protein [Kribbella]|uniref:Big-1 domain-containing protein n=1 Tax=Kribbella karoonensis TaxID=324851 RepID=A0ABN2ETH1_9ACTN
MSIKRTWLIALVAVLVTIGVVESPAAFAAVSTVVFTPGSRAAGATSSWDVNFTPSNGTTGELKAGDKITVTFNSLFTVSTTPVVTLPGGFTGNCTTSVTKPSAAVVLIALAGSTCDLKNASGTVRIDGITNPAAGTYLGSSFSVLTTKDTAGSSNSPIVIDPGAPAKLAFAQGPGNGFAGTALSPAITVQVQDQFGTATGASGIAVSLASSPAGIDAGATATTNASGLATFTGVVINKATIGLTITATAPSLVSAVSAPFNITVAVSSGAVLSGSADDGTGSGVKSVAYYYCAGYSGSCTSANWTLIGSSTSAAASYQVTWTATPAAGAYRVVASSIDNVTNTSQPSTTTPVTVS